MHYTPQPLTLTHTHTHTHACTHRKKRKEKHLEELLKHNNLPSVTTRPNRTFRKFGCSSRPVTTEKSHPPQSTTVRFTAKPTVHFIEVSAVLSVAFCTISYWLTRGVGRNSRKGGLNRGCEAPVKPEATPPNLKLISRKSAQCTVRMCKE